MQLLILDILDIVGDVPHRTATNRTITSTKAQISGWSLRSMARVEVAYVSGVVFYDS